MNIQDYLLDQADKDWAALLSGWDLPETFELWMVNRFGDAFLVFEDGSVHVLDLGACALNRVADNREDFARKAANSAADWFMMPLTDACVASGMIPGASQCYSFKVPPVLGGAYELANVTLTDLAVAYSFAADIHPQVKDLPDGTKIKVVIGKKPGE